jgi:hypothetical protein
MSNVVKEVCELLDATVLRDLSEENFQTVYALGWHSEPDAGIRYGVVTRWFDSMGDLEKWCERNVGRVRDLTDSAPVPDMEDWD